MMCDTQVLERLRAAAASMDGDRLQRAAARHANTQSQRAEVQPGERKAFQQPASGGGAVVVGERKTAPPFTRHSDETAQREPMG